MADNTTSTTPVVPAAPTTVAGAPARSNSAPVDARKLAEAIVARAEGHFHDEQLGMARAMGPLPFSSAPDLQALVSACYPSTDRPSARPRSENQYALMPDTLDFLQALLDRTAPKLILEFGSGESTRLFADWASTNDARLVSVEHERSWVDEVARRLRPEQRQAVTMVHAPLRPVRLGLRQFLTYRFLDQLAAQVAQADLLLLDGPHISGREAVLYFVLANTRPGKLIVVDDFRHYSVREMLIGIPPALAGCFAAVPLPENSHGLYVLQCLRQPAATKVPNLGVRPILRSYWRSLRDFRVYGTGD
ncbi:MAG TPA: class I SAM-dependent methyltransferase [Polyangia bacterium]|nr:class I SAM-dependent methyltransferase [Polyangia bacterium]